VALLKLKLFPLIKILLQVSSVEGGRMARDIKAVRYCECSAKTTEGVREMFEIAALHSVGNTSFPTANASSQTEKSTCILQ